MMKHAAKIDVAVLLLFFNRPESFGLVFAEVKKARPSKLFLYQDGPRGERDMAGIKACREIAEELVSPLQAKIDYIVENKNKREEELQSYQQKLDDLRKVKASIDEQLQTIGNIKE